jgi:toxin ParE1/3/4
MKSNRDLRLTADAEHDLRSILRYSERTWNEHQRNAYGQRIDDALQRLAQFPELGRSREDIGSGWRSYPVGEHTIYYQTDETSVTVFRILHRKMDVSRQLE